MTNKYRCNFARFPPKCTVCSVVFHTQKTKITKTFILLNLRWVFPKEKTKKSNFELMSLDESMKGYYIYLDPLAAATIAQCYVQGRLVSISLFNKSSKKSHSPLKIWIWDQHSDFLKKNFKLFSSSREGVKQLKYFNF